ncbi:MAG TPA: ATP-dependent Clp protease ATP-binding subunit ClpX, partial [Myxococcota bacterium]|nr:ATP-dependent Clp protease ATP-binding subunit ClpX [Myxococcota bacterium]
IREAGPSRPVHWGQEGVPSPQDIKLYLDQYIVGQEEAKRRIAVAVYNHYKRLEANANVGDGDVEVQKSNVLLIGPTGTGKTLVAQTLARFLDVPFVVADATTLTEAGYVGEDVENIVAALYQNAAQNVERTIRGIVYVDEIDKLARKSFTSSVSRDVSGEGVQQALLKILEGTVANIQTKAKQRGPQQESVQIDTTNILFICGGSFEGLARIIDQRLGRRSVGFLKDDADDASAAGPRHAGPDDQRLLKKVTADDLTRFGMIPEFIGRLPVIAVMDPLGVDDLVHVLTEPRNALVKQYQKLFKFEKVKLSFTPEALAAIAEKATHRRAGARGLRAVMEKVMLEVMFDVPSIEGITQVTITEDCVNGSGEPVYVAVPEVGGAS